MSKRSVTFATPIQAALFDHELTGQISDGMWENTANTSWEMWCDADVKVGNDIGRFGFTPRKDNFAFNSKTLLEIIGDRMLDLARLAKVFGYNGDIDIAEIASICRIDYNGVFKVIDCGGEYWDKKRAYVNKVGIDKIEAALTYTSYSTKDLKADLTAIKKTIKITAKDF